MENYSCEGFKRIEPRYMLTQHAYWILDFIYSKHKTVNLIIPASELTLTTKMHCTLRHVYDRQDPGCQKVVTHEYRDRLKSVQILQSGTQAEPGRTGRQEQEQTSRNHVPTF